MSELDLDAYFARVGWRGPVRTDLATLAALLDAHMAHIPFEHLDVLLGRSIRLDLEALQAKLVGARRGGYCFEHATLFAAVLEALGFAPVRHSARVVRFLPAEESPRTHMFLSVPLAEGRFVVDPGLGGYAPRVPVPFADGATATDGSWTYGMARRDTIWTLRLQGPGVDTDLWVSSGERDHPVDFEMGNHYAATHPQSQFRYRLMMRALSRGTRVTVMNRDISIREGGDALPREFQLRDRRELRALITQHFGFDLPEIETMKVPAVPDWA